MRDWPNLRHLYAVAQVVRLGGIRSAADSINLSQPAISQAVRSIENAIGHTLFQRTAAGMFPTESGRRLAERIDRAMAFLQAGQRDLVLRGSGKGAPLPVHHLITTTQLRALIATVENGGFAPAARHIGLAEPSVHRAAKDLEKSYGQVFFRSTSTGIEPTQPARELARCAGLAFAEIDQGFDEVREIAGILSGRLNIGCLPLARTHIAPTAVIRLLRQRPDARIAIIDGSYRELLHGLRHGRIDMIVGALRFPEPSNDIRQETLFSDPLSVVVRMGHPILTCAQPDASILACLDWIVPGKGTPARSHFDAYFIERGLPPPSHIVECSSLIATRGILMQSDRAALLPARQVLYEIQANQLAVISSPMPGTERPIGVTVRIKWLATPLQSAFLGILKSVIDE